MTRVNRQYGDKHCDGPTPFYMGGCLGRRMFFLDTNGILRGVTYRAPWRDGENIAVCFNADLDRDQAPMPKDQVYLYDTGGWGFPQDADGEPGVLPGWKSKACKGLEPECGCGFYAYHDGTIKYAAQGPGLRVEGIVEAYGKMIVGPLGYRAQKAVIKAILVPWQPTAAYSESLRQQYRRAIKDMEQVRDTFRRHVSKRSLAYAITAVLLGWQGGLVGFGAGAALMTLAMLTQLEHREFRSKWTEYHQADLEQLKRVYQEIPDDYDDAIQRMVLNYPGVRFFVNREEMDKAFPIKSLANLAVTEDEEEE